MSHVFSSLQQHSHSGEAMECGDGVNCVLHPGILIESQDGEEANYFCTCQACGHGNYPCPKCLVQKKSPAWHTGTFEPRTSESMRMVIQNASWAETKTDKEKILQAFGLHDIQVHSNHWVGFAFKNVYSQNSFWEFWFSDPHAASCYDTLHLDNLGKGGKHMWELLLFVLGDLGKKGKLTWKWVLQLPLSCQNLIELVPKAWHYFHVGSISNTSTMCQPQHLVMGKHFMTFWR